MSPSRRGDPGRARTPEERERDRLDRERRRARERGASSPVGDDAPLFDIEHAGSAPAPAYDEPWAEPPPPPYSPDHPGEPGPLHTDQYSENHHPGYPDPPAADHPDPPVGYDDPAAPAEDPRRARRAGGKAPGGLGRAAAALGGAAAAGRARLPKTLRVPGRGPAAAQPPATAGGGSLRAAARARVPRRVPAGTAARRRPRTAPVSKTKRNLSAAGAPRSRRGRIAAVVALIGVVFALWFIFSLFQPLKGGGSGKVTVVIPRGASSSTIATLLADRGVISSPFFFKLRATLAGKRSQLESGHFDLRKDMSYGAVLDALTGTQGTPVQITVTIPEGLDRREIASVAKRAGVTGDYVKASVHSHVLKPQAYGATSATHSLEGFLFPATYDLLPGDPASKLVNAQLAAFKTNIASVDLRRAQAKHLSTYDVLTIASMVEREAQLPTERPLIAAVIYNRLHVGMPLGIDATIRYAINDFINPLTASDLRLPSAYNTRTHKGLPPTPIGNPGLASIQAAAHPAAVSYLYYVVKPGTCGQHAFSSSFTQFEQDVARYNSARAAKGGNSPTTCGHP
jgi:UPF0755 protein